MDFEIFGEQVQKIITGEGVPECVIFDVDSIFKVEILSENFSHYTDPGGTWNILLLNRMSKISVFAKFDANLLELSTNDFSETHSIYSGQRLLPKAVNTMSNMPPNF